MGYVFKHAPTFQGMKMLVEPLILVRNEIMVTLEAVMDRSPAFNNLPPNPSGSKH
jgi:hypothetical protein